MPRPEEGLKKTSGVGLWNAHREARTSPEEIGVSRHCRCSCLLRARMPPGGRLAVFSGRGTCTVNMHTLEGNAGTQSFSATGSLLAKQALAQLTSLPLRGPDPKRPGPTRSGQAGVYWSSLFAASRRSSELWHLSRYASPGEGGGAGEGAEFGPGRRASGGAPSYGIVPVN